MSASVRSGERRSSDGLAVGDHGDELRSRQSSGEIGQLGGRPGRVAQRAASRPARSSAERAQLLVGAERELEVGVRRPRVRADAHRDHRAVVVTRGGDAGRRDSPCSASGTAGSGRRGPRPNRAPDPRGCGSRPGSRRPGRAAAPRGSRRPRSRTPRRPPPPGVGRRSRAPRAAPRRSGRRPGTRRAARGRRGAGRRRHRARRRCRSRDRPPAPHRHPSVAKPGRRPADRPARPPRSGRRGASQDDVVAGTPAAEAGDVGNPIRSGPGATCRGGHERRPEGAGAALPGAWRRERARKKRRHHGLGASPSARRQMGISRCPRVDRWGGPARRPPGDQPSADASPDSRRRISPRFSSIASPHQRW